jgi:hypothetical protein
MIAVAAKAYHREDGTGNSAQFCAEMFSDSGLCQYVASKKWRASQPAAELPRCGEADAARVTLRPGREMVW